MHTHTQKHTNNSHNDNTYYQYYFRTREKKVQRHICFSPLSLPTVALCALGAAGKPFNAHDDLSVRGIHDREWEEEDEIQPSSGDFNQGSVNEKDPVFSQDG